MSSRLTIGQEKKSNIIEISDSEDETFKWIENDCSEVIEISDDNEEEPIQSGKRQQRKAIGPRKKVCHPKVVKDDWVY